MRLEDYVRKSIHKYQSLYKGRNYAESRLGVLNHIFLTLGNGLGFSKCGKYITGYIPENLPYGVEVYQGPELKFDDPEDSDHNDFVPYPVFDHCLIAAILAGDGNLEQDWIDGGLDVAQESLRYYSDRQRYQCDGYFPTPRALFSSIDLFEETEDLEDFDFNPEDSILQHGVRSWITFHSKSIQLLGDFLKKFGRETELPVPLAYDDLYKEIHGHLFAPNCLELYNSLGRLLRGNDEWFTQQRDIIHKPLFTQWFTQQRDIVITPLREHRETLSSAS